MKPSYCFYLLFFILLLKGCEKTTTPIATTQISLTAEYVGVTDAALCLQVDSSQPYDALQLLREGQVVLSAPFSTNDTTLLDTTLLPAHTYIYQAALFYKARQSSKSNEVNLTTIDTTSHDFQIDTFSFGYGTGSSYLSDVAIVNDTDIWVVGEIHTPDTDRFDSLGNWIDPYNIVHWNGAEWELKRIYYYYQGSNYWRPIPSTFAFKHDEIWFGNFTKWNGEIFVSIPLNISFPSQVKKMWGTSSNDLYIVGNNGLIAHYNGTTWQKLESATDLPIQDIWGAIEWNTGEEDIFAVASEKYTHSDNNLLKINPDKTVSDIPWPYSANRDPYSLWFNDSYSIFICGDGVVKRNRFGHFKLFSDLPTIFKNRIRGNDINDIFVVGDFGLVAHFNGVNWRVIDDPGFGKFLSVAYKGDIAVAVGEKNSNAVIAILIRNK